MSDQATATLIAVGDVCVDRTSPDSIFDLVRDNLQEADFAFCQIETTYSTRGAPSPVVRVPLRADPANVGAIARAGFNIASFASNHCMDWGPEAFTDTIDHLSASGIGVIGAGRNLADARKPLIVESSAGTIGWLAYCSILPHNYWADGKRPGSAPARARTLYEAIEPDQPGTPPRILSYPVEEDLAAMESDIRALKEKADVVLVSMHWGIHYKEADIAQYQQTYGYAAIDAGADAVLGHHAHILKAVELYRGKPIFHSLCNFAFDLRLPEGEWNNPVRQERLTKLNPSWQLDPAYRSYPFPKDSRKSLLVKIAVRDRKIAHIGMLPVLINQDSQPRCLNPRDPEFTEVVDYLNRITADQKLKTQYRVEDNEIIAT
ncbi:MAG: CapA family protein [Burkholderiales bacterium]